MSDISSQFHRQALETATQSTVLLAAQRDEMYIGKLTKVGVGVLGGCLSSWLCTAAGDDDGVFNAKLVPFVRVAMNRLASHDDLTTCSAPNGFSVCDVHPAPLPDAAGDRRRRSGRSCGDGEVVRGVSIAMCMNHVRSPVSRLVSPNRRTPTLLCGQLALGARLVYYVLTTLSGTQVLPRDITATRACT